MFERLPNTLNYSRLADAWDSRVARCGDHAARPSVKEKAGCKVHSNTYTKEFLVRNAFLNWVQEGSVPLEGKLMWMIADRS